MTLDIPLADDPHVTQPKSTAHILPDAQTVTSVRHWTDGLFSFRLTRGIAKLLRHPRQIAVPDVTHDLVGLIAFPHSATT